MVVLSTLTSKLVEDSPEVMVIVLPVDVLAFDLLYNLAIAWLTVSAVVGAPLSLPV